MAKYDIAIIGGGTVGTMIFLDASSRGYKCILIERKKIGMQTNYASLGLLQAGANYLYKNRMIVYAGAIDCGVFREIAGEFLKIQPMIFPIFPDSNYPLWLWDGYLSAFDYVSRFAYSSRHTILSKKKLLDREPLLKNDVLGGPMYHERWFNPVEFSQAITKAGISFGGEVIENAEAVASCHNNKDFYSVGIKTNEDESIEWINASMFVNACGPWSPKVLKDVFHLPSFETRMTRGTSIIINRELCSAALIVFDENKKYITIMPLGDGRTLVGPTNVDIDPEVSDSPDLSRSQQWEVDKLLGIVNKFLDVNIVENDIVEVKTGLRPQLKHPNVCPNNINHGFVIIDHQKRDGYKNLLTIFGGKLSNQLRMSKELIDHIDRLMDRRHIWKIPVLKIHKDGKIEEREKDNVKKIRRLYKRKLALTYQDNVRNIALIKRVDSIAFLIPFYVAALLKKVFHKRRERK